MGILYRIPLLRLSLLIIGLAAASAVLFAIYIAYPRSSNGENPPFTSKTISNETIISNFQQGHGFVKRSIAGSQTNDQSNFVVGNQSLRLATNGDGAAVFTTDSKISPAVDFSNKFIKIWIKVDDTRLIKELRITVTGDNFRSYKNYWIQGGTNNTSSSYLRNNEWNEVTISPSQTTSFGSPKLSQIDAIQIWVQDRAAGPVSVWLNWLSLIPKDGRGIVSFTFDDGYDSTYTNARPILDKYEFPATAYIVTGKVGAEGRMTLDQLKKLQDLSGWDISSHTVDHANLTVLNRADIETELALSKQFLVDNGFPMGSDHFAYPYGSFDNDALDHLVQEYYKTARTTRGSVETLPPGDPYRLRVLVVANDISPSTVMARVQNAMSNGDWLILVFHNIVDSNADVETAYLRSDFQKVVDAIHSEGVNVMTISEVYNNKYH